MSHLQIVEDRVTVPKLDYVCPSWCKSDHDPQEGTPGTCVSHYSAEVSFGVDYDHLYAYLVHHEGTTDGSDGRHIGIEGDFLAPHDARALARQLVEWADLAERDQSEG